MSRPVLQTQPEHTETKRNEKQPELSEEKRGLTFALMSITLTLHNLSRSLGYAILVVEDGSLALRFFLVEVSEQHASYNFK